ncbi:MAG: aspartate-semialdehyde dehydrogenase [Candidatus Aureabacteria bacterium]|nr:aspartate-semialdehyde dehydrogenase [Candidatus Auribacterota bacterium]
MIKVGFVGWRGMVGSVLMERMKEEKDFKGYESLFFSTSNVGGEGPELDFPVPPLQDANDLNLLSKMDIIVTCQGGDYTNGIYPDLRKEGWSGYWIDAASALRMSDESVIVLDPVNRKVINKALKTGIKTYVGGNCTVSLMLMALAGLFKAKVIEWVSSMTYQAASGAGAKNMQELIRQMFHLTNSAKDIINNPASTALELDSRITDELRSGRLPAENFGVPLAASLIPWIDKAVANGQTREEWKGGAEANKILGTKTPIPVDGICVRVSAMRCHSQGLTVKLKKDVPLDEIQAILSSAHEWVKIVPNNKEDTIRDLTPVTVSGKLIVPIGRLHKMTLGPKFLTAFTVGDQLLWGAAEPIRRILKIVLESGKGMGKD